MFVTAAARVRFMGVKALIEGVLQVNAGRNAPRVPSEPLNPTFKKLPWLWTVKELK